MKKIQKSLLVLLAVAAVLPACKKGAEDPGMPFSSRKKRVEGEWKIQEASTVTQSTSPINNCDGNGATGTATSSGTEKFDASTYSYNGTNTFACAGTTTATTQTLTGTVTTYTMTFDKAGTWSSKMDYTTKEHVDNLAGQSGIPAGVSDVDDITRHYIVSNSGVWNFLGKIQDDTKNKEEISVSTTSSDWSLETTDVHTQSANNVTTTTTSSSKNTSKDTYNNNEVVSIWKLVRLAKKEMKVIRSDKNANSGTSSVTVGNTTTTGTSSSTSSSETTMTWIQ